MNRFLASGAVLSLLMLGACSGSSEANALQQFVDSEPNLQSFTLGDVFNDADRVVVTCAFDDPGAVQDVLGFAWPDVNGMSVQDADQGIIAVTDNTVTAHEVASRQLLDLCGDPEATYPLSVESDAQLTTVEEEWSDNSTYPVVRFG